MHITNIMTISRITSQRFILHPISVHLLRYSLFLDSLYPGGRRENVIQIPVSLIGTITAGFCESGLIAVIVSAGIVRKARVVLLTAWAFVYPVSGISGRVSGSGDIDYNDSLKLRSGAACRRVLVKSGKLAGGFVRDFRVGGKLHWSSPEKSMG